MAKDAKDRKESCTLGVRVKKSARYNMQRRAKKLKISQGKYHEALYKVDKEYPHLIEKFLWPN